MVTPPDSDSDDAAARPALRLVKFLATAGVASRRASERLIADGRVAVDGEVVTDPARDVSGARSVTFDGAAVAPAAELVVWALNKPAGVVSTASDPQGRRTVVSLVDSPLRLYPVGRLDIDSTGLILLTNDGELAHRLTHPRFEVDKTYRATLAGAPISDRAIRALRTGVTLDDGPTAPARVRRVGARAANRIELTIHEGRNRQVRRMCEAVGHRVTELVRVRFGGLELGELGPGRARRLGAPELAALSDSAGGDGRARRSDHSGAQTRR